jgi:hypothetical protein
MATRVDSLEALVEHGYHSDPAVVKKSGLDPDHVTDLGSLGLDSSGT